MTLEQAILEKVRALSLDKQQKILDFAESLLQESHSTPETPIREFYGCIQDETFIRHPQGNQSDHELLA